MTAAGCLGAGFTQRLGLQHIRFLVDAGRHEQAELGIGRCAHVVAVHRLESESQRIHARLDLLLPIITPFLIQADRAENR